MNDKGIQKDIDFGLIVAEAFGAIRTDHGRVSQISNQDMQNLATAEALARLALENLYGANIIHVNLEAYRKHLAQQTDDLASLATKTMPANRAELLATILTDCLEDNELLSRAVDYLKTNERLALLELCQKHLEA